MIKTRRREATLEVSLERPESKNALTLQMYEALTEALQRASQEGAVRAVILRGAPGVFTSGNDLHDFMRAPPTSQDSPVYRFLQALVRFEKPLIAAVDGWAVGIGTTMLLHCDLVYATRQARLKMPFVDLALVPEAGASLLLPRMIGHQKASELLLLSKAFGAEEAARFGLVNEVLEDHDALLERAREVADRIAALAPESVRLTKMLLRRAGHQDASLEGVMSEEGELFIARLQSPEMAEAVTAFFEKRAPKF